MKYRYFIKHNKASKYTHVYRIYPDGTYDFRRDNKWLHLNVAFDGGLEKDKGYNYWHEEVTKEEAFAEML